MNGVQVKPATWRRALLPAGVVLCLVGGVLVAYQFVKGSSSEPRRQVVKIAVLPDAPPPPPPPPPPEKKIEPEVKEVKPQPQEEQPKPQEKPPEAAPLKMEGAAGDGPSAFTSGSVSKDYTLGDPGAGSGGAVANKMQFALFNSQLQRHVQAALARNAKVKVADYRVNVQVWVTPTGELRVELISSTGDEAADGQLRDALALLPPIANVPANLVQPIRMRITNRMTG